MCRAQLKGESRLIRSRAYAADYSLRFPIIERVRWDKPTAAADTVACLADLVAGSAATGTAYLFVLGGCEIWS